MEQKESLEKAENDLRGIIVRTHRHCQTYRVRIRMKGGQCFDRSFRSKTLAKKWKRDMESAIEHDRYEFTNPATKHTLADLINLYIERVLPGKPLNAKNVLRHLTWWKEELGHLLLAQVRPSIIAEKRDELLAGFVRSGKLRSPTTVVRYLSSLSHVFSKVVKEWEWMRENPIFKIEKPKQAQGRKRVLTDEEQKRLLQTCQESGSKDLFLIVALALGTGMRKGEIMGLRWRNIQLGEPKGTIVLERTKNDRSRSVLITGLLLGLLQQRYNQQRADSLVFPSPNSPNQPVDINAESDEGPIKACTALEKEPIYSQARTIHQPLENQRETTLEPTDLSMKNREKEPSEEPFDNHQRTIREPDRNQSGTKPEPLTKKEEKEEEKRAVAAYSRTVYKCLEGLDLSDQEKRSLMFYSEHRLAHAAEFVRRKHNVDSPIGLMMWVCQQPSLPELPKENRKSMTPQQKLAWEYNQFLSSNGYTAQAKQNEEKIPNDRMVILEQGQLMPITLNHPLQILQEDFRKSKEEILKSQRIVRGLQNDKS